MYVKPAFQARLVSSSMLLLSLFMVSSSVAWSNDEAPLSPPFKSLEHPVDDQAGGVLGADDATRLSVLPLPVRSDLAPVLATMTPVKSQGQRGTCSIFSAVAMLEATLVREYGLSAARTDYSEQWLAYLATWENGDEGSSAPTNFRLIRDYGLATERALPYETEGWESGDYTTYPLAGERCRDLKGDQLKVCHYAHHSPELIELSDEELQTRNSSFAAAKASGERMRSKYLGSMSRSYSVGSVSEVKRMLAAGIPLVLEFDFYYGAWNHGEAEDFGIGRDKEAFSRGEVGYPEFGSRDRAESPKHPAGHSVLVVGYDDSAVIKTRVLMKDGQTRDFEYTGVYYFKNSWGTKRFGITTELNGPTPGYGSITQKYAHELGAFYQMPIR